MDPEEDNSQPPHNDLPNQELSTSPVKKVQWGLLVRMLPTDIPFLVVDRSWKRTRAAVKTGIGIIEEKGTQEEEEAVVLV
jgi:hypothetical protein